MIKAKIVAVDEVKSKKGNTYYRLWIVTESNPRPMRIVTFTPHKEGEFVTLKIVPDYQCNAILQVVD